MQARQQILASIIDEGHQMIQYGDAFDESADFERKLEQLEDRWHSVVRRANQRKTVVDGAVNQWQQYQVCSYYRKKNRLNLNFLYAFTLECYLYI